MIHRVVLNNFRSHKHNDVTIPTGVCAISGPNGSGKSTILNAVGLALFDFLPEGVRATDWIKHGEKDATIEVTFQARDGLAYTVHQKILRNGQRRTKIIGSDGREVALSTNTLGEAYALIRDLLAVGPDENLSDLFQHFIGVPQRELVGVFGLGPKDRSLILDRAFGIDGYRTAAGEKLTPIRAAAKDARQRLDVEQAGLLSLTANKTEVEAAKVRAETDLTNSTKAIKELTPSLDAALKTKKKFDDQAREVQRLELALSKKTGLVNHAALREKTAKDHLKEAKDAAAFVKGNEPKWNRLLQDEATYKTTDASRKTIEQQVRPVRVAAKNEAGLAERVNAGTKAVKTADEAAKRRTELQQYDSEADRLEQAQEKLQARRTAFETAQEKVNHIKAQIADLEKESKGINDLTARVAKLEPVAEDLKTLTGALKTAQADAQSAKTQYDILQKAVRDLEKGKCPVMPVNCPIVKDDPAAGAAKKLKELQDGEVDKRADAEKVEAAKHRAEKAQNDLTETKNDLKAAQKARNQADALAEKLKAIKFDPSEDKILRDAQTELNGLKKEHSKQRVDMEKLRSLLLGAEKAKSELDGATADLAALRIQIAPLADLEKQLDKTTKTCDELLARLDALKEFRGEYVTTSKLAAKLAERDEAANDAKEKLMTARTEAEGSQNDHNKAKLDYDANEHEKSNRLVSETQDKLATEKEKARNLTDQVKERKEALAKILKNEKRLTELKTEIRDADAVLSFLNDLGSILKDAGNAMARYLTRRAARDATRYYRGVNGNEAKELDFGDNYELQVKDGATTTTFRNLSGGEQVASAVSVRLALINNMKGFEFAFFDEPTQNMDAEARRHLAHLLTHAESFKQLVVISHSDEFDSDTGYVIRVRPSAAGSVIA